MTNLPECCRDTEILFLIVEFLEDNPDGSIMGFGRWLIDKEYEIRKFTVEPELQDSSAFLTEALGEVFK